MTYCLPPPYSSQYFDPSLWNQNSSPVTFADLAGYAKLSGPSFVNGIKVQGGIVTDTLTSSGLITANGGITVTNGATVDDLAITKNVVFPPTMDVPSNITITPSNFQMIYNVYGTNTQVTLDETTSKFPSGSQFIMYNNNSPGQTNFTIVQNPGAGPSFYYQGAYNYTVSVAVGVTAVLLKKSSSTYTDWLVYFVSGDGTNIYNNAPYAPLNSPAFTGTPTAPTATAGTNTTQLATTAFCQTAAQSTYPKATYFLKTNAASLPFVVTLQAGQLTYWDLNDYYTLRFSMAVGYGASSAGSTNGFACATGTMLVYPQRCNTNWCVQTSLPTLANVNNQINGVVNYDYVNAGTTNAGNAICPGGREFFCIFTATGGNSGVFSLGGTSNQGDLAFYIQNPNSGGTGYFFAEFTLELVNHGNPHGVLSTTGFQTNFSQ